MKDGRTRATRVHQCRVLSPDRSRTDVNTSVLLGEFAITVVFAEIRCVCDSLVEQVHREPAFRRIDRILSSIERRKT